MSAARITHEADRRADAARELYAAAWALSQALFAAEHDWSVAEKTAHGRASMALKRLIARNGVKPEALMKAAA